MENFKTSFRKSYMDRQLKDSKIEIEDILKKCTYNWGGDVKIRQKEYSCTTCCNEKKKICEYCFKNCHTRCKSNSNTKIQKKQEENQENQRLPAFVCECGKVKNHKTSILKEDMEECHFYELDIKVGNKKIYKCKSDDMNLCSICYHECHESCEMEIVPKTEKNEEEMKNFKCSCNSNNHSKSHEFNFKLSFQDYQKKLNLEWPVQILNGLFSGKLFDDLKEVKTNVGNLNEVKINVENPNENKFNLNDENLKVKKIENIFQIVKNFHNSPNENFKIEYINAIYVLTEIFKLDIKTYYYHPEITKIFSYKILLDAILENKSEPSNSKDDFSNKMTLLQILFYLHLKKDFHLIKSFKISDFMTSTILERLYNRKFILSSETLNKYKFNEKINHKNIEEENLFKTYAFKFNESKDKNKNDKDNLDQDSNKNKGKDNKKQLKSFILNIENLFEKRTEAFEIKDFPEEYLIYLKVVTFLLKKMIFKVKDLNMLIESLHKINEKIYVFMSEELKDKKVNKDFQEEFKDKNVNKDLQEEELNQENIKFFLLNLKQEKFKKKLQEKVIFSVVVKEALKQKDDANKLEQIKISIFSYLVKILYLIGINYNDLITKKQLKGKNQKHNDKDNKFIHSNNDSVGKLFEMLIKNSKVISYYYKKIDNKNPIGKLTPKIIKIYNEALKLFSMADNSYFYQLKQINDEDFELYKNRLEKLLQSNTISKETDKETCKENAVETNVLLNDENKTKQIELKECKEDLELKDLKTKVEEILEKFFTLKDEKLENKKFINLMVNFSGNLNKENIDLLIDNLILSAIDETLSKYFSFLCIKEEKVDNIKTISKVLDCILPFFSLFLKNKVGIKYFLSGKNISTLMKIFKVYSLEELYENKILKTILNFLYMIFKQLKLYKIDISNNYIIQIVKNELFNFIDTNPQNLNPAIGHKKEGLEMLNIIDIKPQNFNPEEDLEMLNIIFKIFIKMIPFLDNKEVEEIKNIVFGVMDETSLMLLLKEKFRQIIIDINYDPNKPNSSFDLFFSFIKLLTIKTFYIYNEENEKVRLKKIFKFMDLELYESVLKEDNVLSLKHRTILINFIRTYYFIDLLDKDETNEEKKYLTNEEKNNLTNEEKNNLKKYLTNEEYVKYKIKEEDNNNNNNNKGMEKGAISSDSDEIKKDKYESINRLHKVISLFVYEIENGELILKKLIERNEKATKIEKYILQIILTTKIISDFIYLDNDIINNTVLYFYQLAKAFISKATFYRRILIKINLANKTHKNMSILLDNKDIKPSKGNSDRIKELEKINFDIFNKRKIYNLILKTLTEFMNTPKVKKIFNMTSFLEKYDNKVESNFTNFELIETKDYEYFYKSEKSKNPQKKEEEKKLSEEEKKLSEEEKKLSEEEKKLSEEEKKLSEEENKQGQEKKLSEEENKQGQVTNKTNILEELCNNFKKDFLNINNSTFNKVLFSISEDEELIELLVEYFINCIRFHSKKNKNKSYTYDLLCIINKLLFYNTKLTQEKFVLLLKKEKAVKNNFFYKLSKLQNFFQYNFSLCKNPFAIKQYEEITNKNKLTIQFLQLLSEGFNTSFHKEIFGQDEEGKDKEGKDKEGIDKEGIDKEGKYKEGKDKEGKNKTFNFFDHYINNLITSFELMKLKYFAEGILPYDKLIVLNTNIIDFLVEYISSCDDPELRKKIHTNILKLFDKQIHKFLFINNNKELDPKIEGNLFHREYRKNVLTFMKINLLKLLISSAQTKPKKEDIQKLSKEWQINPSSLFRELLVNFEDFPKIRKLLLEEKFNSDNFKTKLLKMYINNSDDFSDSMELKLCFKFYTLIKILSDLNGLKSISTLFDKYKIKMGSKDNNLIYYVYLFFEQLVCKVEIRNKDNDEKFNKFTFFVRPPLTFHLTYQTQHCFMENVNRDSQFNKQNSLVQETDYFRFEMIFNSQLDNTNYVHRYMKIFDFKYREFGNYVFIVLHQCLLIYENYRSTELDKEAYENVNEADLKTLKLPNLITGVVQIFYLTFSLVVWFYYKFNLYYQHMIMQNLKKTLKFRNDKLSSFNNNNNENSTTDIAPTNSSDEISKDKENNLIKKEHKIQMEVIEKMNSHVSILTKIKICLFDSILMNREVNILLFTLILLILFLTLGSPLIIVFPVLFIANLNTTLFDIFKSVKLRYRQLSLVLIFTFLIIYVFSWITIIWMRELYIFSDVVTPGVKF